MTEKGVLNYIKNPELIQNADLKELKYFVWNNPFYQTGHFILLKYLKDNNSDEYDEQLIRSSIHVSDRDRLFRFLNTNFAADVEEKREDGQKEESVVSEIVAEKEQEKIENRNKKGENLLKDRSVKRKINNSFEGMGENISETISSQLEFSVVKKNDKLEYPSEIYFIDEERNGTNNVLTIDADPDEIKNLRKKRDILQIEEEQGKEKIENEQAANIKVKEEDAFELIENAEVEKNTDEKKSKQNDYFDINHYADESIDDNNDLISKFLDKNPRIEPKETKEENEDISKESIEENLDLLSETLIKVYIKQELFEKAIQSYRKLSLKYPEKNTYFASQIKILEDKINK